MKGIEKNIQVEDEEDRYERAKKTKRPKKTKRSKKTKSTKTTNKKEVRGQTLRTKPVVIESLPAWSFPGKFC